MTELPPLNMYQFLLNTSGQHFKGTEFTLGFFRMFAKGGGGGGGGEGWRAADLANRKLSS